MWGTYSENHGGVDFTGTRASLRDLAVRLVERRFGRIPLDDPPPEWLAGDRRKLDALEVIPDESAPAIVLKRNGSDAVIAGPPSPIARVIGGALANLAASPYRMTPGSVPTHQHIEPADGYPYSPESTIGIVFHLAPQDETDES